MIDPKVPGKVTCKGRPNFLVVQGFEDWLFDCAMAREAEVQQIAECVTAAPVQLEAAEMSS